MKGIIYLLSQFRADTIHPRQILHTCPRHFLQAPELLQQVLASLGAQTRYGFQRRGCTTTLAALSVPGDRKSVGFIPNILDKVQGSGIGRQYNFRFLSRQVECFQAGFTIRSLGYPQQYNAADL